MSVINWNILYINDPLKGRPLFNGKIFVGEPDLDPEIVINQKQLNVVQEDGTVVAVPQPFILSAGGAPMYNGSPVRLDVDGNFSIKILDRNDSQTYYIENIFEGQPVTVEELPGLTDTTIYPIVETYIINDLSQAYEFATLDDAVTSTISFPPGKVINIKERTTGNGGGAMWDVVLASSVTPNTFNIVQCTGAPTLALVLRLDEIKVEQWGAIGDNASGSGTDNTPVFNAVMEHLISVSGGVAEIGEGNFALDDFTISDKNIVFQGTDTGNKYGTEFSGTVLSNVVGARFVARLKGTSTVPLFSTGAAEGSGFRNLQIKENSVSASDYGLFIDSSSTIFENASVIGFNYGTVIADQANANVFRDCQFMLAAKVNFLINEPQANSFMHPAITDISSVSNTTIIMDSVRIRRGQNIAGGGFGMILRSVIGGSFKDVVIESNAQAGLYMYRPDTANLRVLNFENLWLENNYESYTSGSTSFSITSNRALLESAGVPITWDSLTQAGYQVIIDSQSRQANEPDGLTFNTCQFNCAGTDQKSILGLAGSNLLFNNPHFTNGDTANLVSLTNDVKGCKWVNPLLDNNPLSLVESITDNFGANAGSSPVYIKTALVTGGSEDGFDEYVLGSVGGGVKIPALPAGDPRITEVNTLHEYFERAPGPTVRTSSVAGYIQTNENSVLTKIGRSVHMEVSLTLESTTSSGANQQIYIPALPYPSYKAGNVVGQCRITNPTGATILNDGLSPVFFFDTVGVIGALDVLGPISAGDKFDVSVVIDWTTTS